MTVVGEPGLVVDETDTHELPVLIPTHFTVVGVLEWIDQGRRCGCGCAHRVRLSRLNRLLSGCGVADFDTPRAPRPALTFWIWAIGVQRREVFAAQCLRRLQQNPVENPLPPADDVNDLIGIAGADSGSWHGDCCVITARRGARVALLVHDPLELHVLVEAQVLLRPVMNGLVMLAAREPDCAGDIVHVRGPGSGHTAVNRVLDVAEAVAWASELGADVVMNRETGKGFTVRAE